MKVTERVRQDRIAVAEIHHHQRNYRKQTQTPNVLLHDCCFGKRHHNCHAYMPSKSDLMLVIQQAKVFMTNQPQPVAVGRVISKTNPSG